MSRVPAAENLASRMLTAFPRGRISAQDALLHDFFSPLPPQLYQVPAGKLTLHFILPRKSCCTCYLLWASSLFWKSLPFTWRSLFSACTPSPLLYTAKFISCGKFDNLFFWFFSTWPLLILQGDLDGLLPWSICKAQVYVLWQVISCSFCNRKGLNISLLTLCSV